MTIEISHDIGQLFGVHDGMPLKLGEKRAAADFPALDKCVGMEVQGKDGYKARLVRLNIAAGLTQAEAECKAFCYSLVVDQAAPVNDVQLALLGGAISLKRVCGVTVPGQKALVDNDLFWLVFDGPVLWGTLGDDAADIAIGEYVAIDDDADTGKLKSLDTTFTAEYTIGVSLDVAAADGDQFRFRPHHPLRG